MPVALAPSMSTYSSIFKRCPILTTSAFLFACLAPLGCKLINVKTVGVPGLDDSPVEATNAAPAPAPAPAPNPEQSRIDFVQKFAPALGANARYSAAVAHGMPTACEKNERVVSMLWDFELSASREDPTSNGYLSLACFPIHGKEYIESNRKAQQNTKPL
mgnify:CR=1 FL=1